VLLLVRRLRLRIDAEALVLSCLTPLRSKSARNITDCRIAPETPARSVSQWAESIELLDQNAVGFRRFFREASKNDI
jgi:hypothetical protein